MPELVNTSSNQKTKKKHVLLQVLGYAYNVNRPLFIVLLFLSIIIAGSSMIGSLFIQQFIDNIIEPNIGDNWTGMNDTIIQGIVRLGSIMGGIYLATVVVLWLNSYGLTYLTQNLMHKLRQDMFNHMESLPISYFDSHHHGEIMSYYTNDVDTLRQLISQALPSAYQSIITALVAFGIMVTFSIYLTLIAIVFAIIMVIVSKIFSGKSSKAFLTQQGKISEIEGYIEEMVAGQKVIKVFNHEKEALEGFDKINEEVCKLMTKGNKFGNALMPAIGNLGTLMYICVAFVGSFIAMFSTGDNNLTITGINTLSMGVVISFLTLARVFTNGISQTSSQIAMIVLGMAGSKRVFEFLAEESEVDNGVVTLVNCTVDEDGAIHECKENTNCWAWKQPANDKYPLTYRLLRGDIRFYDVDFGYVKDKIVLHDISLYAKPGQKIAFVGPTGAGKTTITNLINRFYDIADGKIRYDDININTIKKADLRRSLGVILQDTNLFTGTIMDNIRYGRLDATDEECIAAAKLANADDFIKMLPEGYNTVIDGDGGSLSQGQKQLISIARCAVSNPPVMIMDEATSSIDTRTEAIVQKGMDQIMEGRTVFVIAHRLSTIRNSKAIMVLQNGRIIERGEHEDLLKQKGLYYQLYTGAIEME